jgi:hypothetical protein
VIVGLVTGVAMSSLVSVLLIVSTWGYMWQFSLVVVASYVGFLVAIMALAYRRLYVPGSDGPFKVTHMPRPGAEAPDPMPSLPKPVYGGVRASPEDSRL